jgi:spore coat polysaccharide biosynthesis protein SpsF (cytidylyltransferase family)
MLSIRRRLQFPGAKRSAGKTMAKIHIEKRIIIILKRVRAIKSLSEERVFLQ